MKALKTDKVTAYLDGNEDLALAGKISKETIDFMTCQIKAIESAVKERVELTGTYKHLLTIAGVGKILGY